MAEERAWIRTHPPTLTISLCLLPQAQSSPHASTHWSQTVGRVPCAGRELVPVATLTEPCARGGPVPLGFLMTDSKELEMPSLVAQDHCLGGDNADSGRPL